MSRAGFRSRRAELAALRAELVKAGATVPQIAAAIRARFSDINSRAACRYACGMTQQDVADRWNQLWPSDRPLTSQQVSYWETWPAPSGRPPSIQDLTRLARIYQCHTADLIDGEDATNDPLSQPATADGGALLDCHRATVENPASRGGNDLRRRTFIGSMGALCAPARVLQALAVVTLDQAGTLATACDSLTELISHYCEKLPLSDPNEIYDDLLTVRVYAGDMLDRAKTSPQLRHNLTVAAGWLSNLLAVATSDMADHDAALVWCTDAERRSQESGLPDLAGWAVLTKATIAYYQGRAGRSVGLAAHGQRIVPKGKAVHAKLAAQEMRARAMLADTDGMHDAKLRAARALAALPSEATASGIFSIVPSEQPPYTATSLLLAGRYREAASVTRSVIESAYPVQGHSRQASAYARTLLILGLAEANLGRIAEAAAAGRAALVGSADVWSTRVLASKLDHALTRGSEHGFSSDVAEFHALCQEAFKGAHKHGAHVPPPREGTK